MIRVSAAILTRSISFIGIILCIIFWFWSHLGTFYTKKPGPFNLEFEFFVEHGSAGVSYDPGNYTGKDYMLQGPFMSYKSAPDYVLRKPRPSISQTICGHFEFKIGPVFIEPFSGKKIERTIIIFPLWFGFAISVLFFLLLLKWHFWPSVNKDSC